MSKLSKVLRSAALKRGIKLARKRLFPIIMNEIRRRKSDKKV
ncbi:hypothetical protein ACFOU2_20345 [Bacillus songklensis]|uniref:Uncharacterized protein n=1 Tax=Bacillus songklensis TaxID=1069116 RepID=A0ABV8B5X3_9BACI